MGSASTAPRVEGDITARERPTPEQQELASLGLKVAASRHPKADQAACELHHELYHPDLGFVLFFVSAEYALDPLAQALESTFGGLPLAGCTTAG